VLYIQYKSVPVFCSYCEVLNYLFTINQAVANVISTILCNGSVYKKAFCSNFYMLSLSLRRVTINKRRDLSMVEKLST